MNWTAVIPVAMILGAAGWIVAEVNYRTGFRRGCRWERAQAARCFAERQRRRETQQRLVGGWRDTQ
jgi:hypothetical protein